MSYPIIKKVIQSALLLFVAILPLFFISENILLLTPLKTFFAVALGLLAFIGILIFKIRKNTFTFTKDIYIWSILSILVSMFLSVIFSDASHISFMGRQIGMSSFTTIVSLFIFAYVIFALFKEVKEKQKLSLIVFLSSVVTVILNLLFVLVPFLPSLGFFNTNLINTIGSISQLGIFSVFTVISSILVVHFFQSKKLYKTLGYIGIVSGLVLLSIINMWSLFAILALFCLIYIVLQVVLFESSVQEQQERHISYPALIVLIFSIVFVLIGGKIGLILNTSFNMQSVEVRPTITNTILVTKDVLLNEPALNKIFGLGVDRFNVAWLQYRPLEINSTQFWDTDFKAGHSYVSSIGVTQGIVGILIWALFILFSLMYVFKVYKKTREISILNFSHIYSTTGFLFFLLILTMYNPSTILFVLFFVFLGMFLRTIFDLGLVSSIDKDITKSPRISFVYILTITLLLIGAIYVLYAHTIQYSSSLIVASATKDFNENQNSAQAIQKINQAQFLFDTDIYNKALVDLIMIDMNSIISDSELTQEQMSARFSQMLQSISLLGQQIIAYDLKSYANYLYVLNVYKALAALGVQDAAKQAIEIIDQTSNFVPHNPTLLLEKARVHVILKDLDNAIKYAEEALVLKPNYIEAAFLLSQIQAEKGDLEKAISSIKTGITQNRFEPTLYFQLGLLYYNQSKYSDAIVSFSDALTLSPEFNNAKYFLGLSYYQNKQSNEAIELFESLAQLFPENEELQKILSNIRAGREVLSGIQNESNVDTLPVAEEVVTEEE